MSRIGWKVRQGGPARQRHRRLLGRRAVGDRQVRRLPEAFELSALRRDDLDVPVFRIAIPVRSSRACRGTPQLLAMLVRDRLEADVGAGEGAVGEVHYSYLSEASGHMKWLCRSRSFEKIRLSTSAAFQPRPVQRRSSSCEPSPSPYHHCREQAAITAT